MVQISMNYFSGDLSDLIPKVRDKFNWLVDNIVVTHITEFAGT